MSDKEFVKGLFVEAPRENAPSFVKGRISIKVEDFIEYLKEKKSETGYVNIDLKEAKNGKYYAELNTWKPSKKSEKEVLAKYDIDTEF